MFWESRIALPEAGRAGAKAHTRFAAGLSALRPKQWTKNLFVVAAIIFSGHLLQADDLRRVAWAFVVFCAASSAGYVLNDLVDADADRKHPTKRFRTIASGQLSAETAKLLVISLGVASILGGLFLGPVFSLVVVAYLALTVGYTFLLKNLFLVDLLAICGGFVLRSAAGAVAIGVPISAWLYVLTFLVSLFLVVGKRRSESVTARLAWSRGSRAPRYDVGILDVLSDLVLISSLIAYVLYALLSSSLPTDRLMGLTIPLVAFGMFRYRFLVRRRDLGGSPEEAVLGDAPMIFTFLGWSAAMLALLYWIK